MTYDRLVCANCAAPVNEGRCGLCRANRERLQQEGVAIESEVTWPGGGRSIYFRDPAGNSLEFAMAGIWGL